MLRSFLIFCKKKKIIYVGKVKSIDLFHCGSFIKTDAVLLDMLKSWEIFFLYLKIFKILLIL